MPTLGYWPTRGCIQPVRFLLAYLKIEYTNKLYDQPEEWFDKDKKELDLDFPNLPYYIDEDIKLTESAAIPDYIIRKNKRYDLLGQNPDGSFNLKEAKVKEVLGVLIDMFYTFAELCYDPNFAEKKEKVLTEKLAPKLLKVEAYFGQNDYIAGESITYPDFIFYEVLNNVKNIFPDYLSPQFAAFMLRFENLPGIKEYLAKPNVDLNIFYYPAKATYIGPKSH